MDELKRSFLRVGWELSRAIADGSVCTDGSCFRCRLARVLLDVELQLKLEAPAE